MAQCCYPGLQNCDVLRGLGSWTRYFLCRAGPFVSRNTAQGHAVAAGRRKRGGRVGLSVYRTGCLGNE